MTVNNIRIFRFLVLASVQIMSSGLVRGAETDGPRLLRSNGDHNSPTTVVIEGLERDAILKEFRFEKMKRIRAEEEEYRDI